MNKAGIELYTKETIRYGWDACAKCFNYALLHDFLCLNCSLEKGR